MLCLAVNNCKALLEKRMRSLLPPVFNNLCGLACYALGSRFMTYAEEMHVFNTELAPWLRPLRVTRDNYAQTGPFCQIKGFKTGLFTKEELRLVRYKYKNADADALFRLFETDRADDRDGTSGATLTKRRKRLLGMDGGGDGDDGDGGGAIVDPSVFNDVVFFRRSAYRNAIVTYGSFSRTSVARSRWACVTFAERSFLMVFRPSAR